jgi:hypothetical protein
MAIYSNLFIDQGTDFSADIDVTDEQDNALDLTGYTAAGQIRRSYTSKTAVDFTTTIKNETEGKLKIDLSSIQTESFQAGRYVYDVEITSSGGIKTRVLEGQITITPGVTKI